MFTLTVLRILLALCLLTVVCAGQKSFLKGLLIGSILGHKKGSMLHEKGEYKDINHYEKEYYPTPEKEYIPVPIHEEPKYIPVYIVKECNQKKYSVPSPIHHHHHEHSYPAIYDDNKLGEFETGGYPGSYEEDFGGYSDGGSKYSGTLDGYSETKSAPVTSVTTKPVRKQVVERPKSKAPLSFINNRGPSVRLMSDKDQNFDQQQGNLALVLTVDKENQNKYEDN